jgi:hypothetical protein
MGEKGTRIVEGKVAEITLELYRKIGRLPKWDIANWFEYNERFFITAKVKLRTDKYIVY